MDKRYYYRILGLREGATASDIKKAYTLRMQKLKSSDYADDPEYVARKMDQARHAYKVLLGGAIPETAEHRAARYEEYKDAEEEGEDALKELKAKFKRHVKKCKEPSARGMRKTTVSRGDLTMPSLSKEAVGKAVTLTLSILVFLVSSVGGCSAIFDDSIIHDEPQYEDGDVLSYEGVQALTWDRVETIIAWNHDFDYYGWLDTSTMEEMESEVNWEPLEYEETDIWSRVENINYSLDLYSTEETFLYLTDYEESYWDTDPLERAEIIVSIMDPPSYEEIAGSINLYDGEYILSYTDYYNFLDWVAGDQIDYVAGSTDWDYYFENY